jgi:O-6-methylguanine DNA methyltransferase
MLLKLQKNPPQQIFWSIAKIPAGNLVIGITAQGELCRASLLGRRKPETIIAAWQANWKLAHFTKGAAIKNVTTLPCLIIGTEFQKNVIAAIMRIRRGEIASYGDIARQAGYPRAARAVGAVCRDNILSYIVPCHRVVSAAGLGGYGPDGLETKRHLLKKEGVIFHKLR